jgi:hypothetical protein
MQPIVAILILGNSLTYTNDLPALLAASSPVKAHVESVTAPGSTLQILYEQTDALAKLRSRKWDYVVLQDQGSLGVAYLDGVQVVNNPAAFFFWSRVWDREIKAAGAKTVIFHTWTRKANRGEQHMLDYAYVEIAKELKAILAPVGLAWKQLPPDPLYMPDDSHPTVAGSYLTACVITQALFSKACINEPSPVTPLAPQLRAAAEGAVRSVPTLKIPKPEYASIKEPPIPVKPNPTDFNGTWTGETRFYRSPAKLTLKVTADEKACRIEYTADSPNFQYKETKASCTWTNKGMTFTIFQPTGIFEIHTAAVLNNTMIGTSQLAPYTGYFRREAGWLLRRPAH